jgi:hypothetical protein
VAITSIEAEIGTVAARFARTLKSQVDLRVKEMERDDTSHYLIYQVLGLAEEEGRLIDVYQNKGRFLYKYAGSFLEEAAKLCFKQRFPDSGALRIPNTEGKRPANFEIDCVAEGDGVEIKWRDATTDGDHITKEHTRLKVVRNAGYTPIRVMFYYPNRAQAVKIQRTLETLYKGAGGQYYFGDAAWKYMIDRTGIDLKGVLEKLAAERRGHLDV